MEREKTNFLFALAGVRQEVLALCPTERVKFQSLGLAILITSGIATVSMWFALDSAIGVNAILALIGAIIWGFVILGIDRWLVSSMPTSGRRRWTIALPRLLLALLLGSLISTPIVLRVFQSEIDAQIVLIKQQRANEFLAAQLHSHVGQQVAFWTRDVTNLQKVIDSGGNVSLDRTTDSIIQALTKQRATELKLKQMYYGQWQCQLYGGPGCPSKGNGPLAAASHRSYLQAAAQVAGLNGQIQHRDKQLTASDAASRKIRYQQAKAALPAAEQQLAAARARQDALQQKYDTQNLATNGLLIRLQALGELSGNSFTINAARLLLFLLFLVIECLPVTVKLMQQPGIYEKILETKKEQELRDARRSLHSQPRAGGTPQQIGNAPIPTVADLHKLWQQPAATRAMPIRERSAPDETSREEQTQVEEDTQFDDQELRAMEGMTAVQEPEWPAGGIELHYGDDDL